MVGALGMEPDFMDQTGPNDVPLHPSEFGVAMFIFQGGRPAGKYAVIVMNHASMVRCHLIEA